MKFIVVNIPLILNSKIYPVGSIVNLSPSDYNLPNVLPYESNPLPEGILRIPKAEFTVPMTEVILRTDHSSVENQLSNDLTSNTIDGSHTAYSTPKRGRPKKHTKYDFRQKSSDNNL